jgi:hypothetical protein
MRKLWILLIALVLVVVGLPAFAADTTVKGNFLWMGNGDPDYYAASLLKARVKFDTKVDDFNNIYVELRYDNGAVIDPGADWNPAGTRVKAFKLTSDLTGALGMKQLPFTLQLVAGVWESDFAYGYFATQCQYEGIGNGYDALYTAMYDQQQSSGAAQLNIGFGPANLHLYQNFTAGASGATMLGADATFGPVGVFVNYKAFPAVDFAKGTMSVEAKFAQNVGPIALSVYPAFQYNLDSELYAWDVSAGGKYDKYGLAIGLQGDKDTALRKVVGELNFNPTAKASLWVSVYMDMIDDALRANAFQGLDIMGSYTFGATKIVAGYVIGGEDKYLVPVYGWNTTYRNGPYLGIDCSF